MRARDALTLVKDFLCMIVATGGAAWEAYRPGEPRLSLLAFYLCLLGFGTAVPAALSLFGSTSQVSPSDRAPVGTASASTPPVDLTHPARVRRGGSGRQRSR